MCAVCKQVHAPPTPHDLQGHARFWPGCILAPRILMYLSIQMLANGKHRRDIRQEKEGQSNGSKAKKQGSTKHKTVEDRITPKGQNVRGKLLSHMDPGLTPVSGAANERQVPAQGKSSTKAATSATPANTLATGRSPVAPRDRTFRTAFDGARHTLATTQAKKQRANSKAKANEKRSNPSTPTPQPKSRPAQRQGQKDPEAGLHKVGSHMDPGLTPVTPHTQEPEEMEGDTTMENNGNDGGDNKKDQDDVEDPTEEPDNDAEGDEKNANETLGGKQDEAGEETDIQTKLKGIMFKKNAKEEAEEPLTHTQKMRAVQIEEARAQYNEVRAIHDELAKSIKKLEERAKHTCNKINREMKEKEEELLMTLSSDHPDVIFVPMVFDPTEPSTQRTVGRSPFLVPSASKTKPTPVAQKPKRKGESPAASKPRFQQSTQKMKLSDYALDEATKCDKETAGDATLQKPSIWDPKDMEPEGQGAEETGENVVYVATAKGKRKEGKKEGDGEEVDLESIPEHFRKATKADLSSRTLDASLINTKSSYGSKRLWTINSSGPSSEKSSRTIIRSVKPPPLSEAEKKDRRQIQNKVNHDASELHRDALQHMAMFFIAPAQRALGARTLRTQLPGMRPSHFAGSREPQILGRNWPMSAEIASPAEESSSIQRQVLDELPPNLTFRRKKLAQVTLHINITGMTSITSCCITQLHWPLHTVCRDLVRYTLTTCGYLNSNQHETVTLTQCTVTMVLMYLSADRGMGHLQHMIMFPLSSPEHDCHEVPCTSDHKVISALV
ncbi:hypothetical protein DFH28DRAFT_937432, partial [Melampsora americana]